MTKQQLEREIKNLRGQMVRLEEACKKREDLLVKFLMDLSPIFKNLTPAMWAHVNQVIEDLEDD